MAPLDRCTAGVRGRLTVVALNPLFAIPAVIAGGYYALALMAIFRRQGRKKRPRISPPVSILKPIHTWDARIAEAISTHIRQDYPQFEILLGVRPNALEQAEAIAAGSPNVRIVPVTTMMPNGKVGALTDLAAAAEHSILIINDADICVSPDYLSAVTAPLSEPGVGLVTALYRAHATSGPAHFEALGVATEFAPSVLVARMLGVAEFALGSTMAVRKADLERIGGLGAIGDYLADDYQLGAHITRLGLHVAFAETVVETTLGAGRWSNVWRHQVRWSRTIRFSRPLGYYGYVLTHATVWAALAAAAGYGWIAASVLGVRVAAGVLTARTVLHDQAAVRRWWMIPVRDLFGFAVWLTAAFGKTVVWRGMTLHLSRDGRIHTAPDRL